MKTKFVLWDATQLSKKGLLPICSNLAVTLDEVAGSVEVVGVNRKLLINVGCKKQPQTALAVSCYLVTRRHTRVSKEERAEILVDEKTGKISVSIGGNEEDRFAGCISDITRWLSERMMKRLFESVPA
jgi:hypothetical protein